MGVRAKFWVKEIRHMGQGDVQADDMAEIVMAPVFDDDNKDWSKYTPQGELKMTVTNPSAIEQFDLNKKFYLDFTPVG